MSDPRTVLPAPELLSLIDVRAGADAIELRAETSSRTARCPVCGKRSGRIHSRCARTLADLAGGAGQRSPPARPKALLRRGALRQGGLRGALGRGGGAKASGIDELEAFAVKLLQDTEAVVNAMILPRSQGQTEGRLNKLKLVKRSMYGRGKFGLLRRRMLYAAGRKAAFPEPEAPPASLHQILGRTTLPGQFHSSTGGMSMTRLDACIS